MCEGADIEARDVDAWTPLIWAAHYGNLGTMELLLLEGADKAVQDRDGDTVTDHICQCSTDSQGDGVFACPRGGCESSSIVAVMEDTLQ